MAEPTDPDDPAAADQVWIQTTHVIKHHTGTYEILVYDQTGEELVHAPLVPDATSKENAQARFWSAMEGYAPEIASPFN